MALSGGPPKESASDSLAAVSAAQRNNLALAGLAANCPEDRNRNAGCLSGQSPLG